MTHNPNATPEWFDTAPVDPTLPLELSDGTPCEIRDDWGQSKILRVRVLGEYDGKSGGNGPYNISYIRETGLWNGSHLGEYPLLRNVRTMSLPATEARFEVRSGVLGTNRDEWSAIAEYSNGKEAAAYVAERKALYAGLGKSLVIVKCEPNPEAANWREREAERLASGHYTPLPSEVSATINASYPDHFAHVAQSDKRKVAFTETSSAGERDRQKVLSASAYVSRYFTQWGEAEQGSFVAEMLGLELRALFVPLGDADALQAIYEECGNTDGMGSCMAYGASHYKSQFHPVRVYAMGGEITLALLRADSDGQIDYGTAWDGEGSIVARCLVLPGTKKYARVYGDCGNARALRNALEAQGFSRDEEMRGARIAKVEASNGGYVLPYLDIGSQSVTDCGDHFEAGGGEMDASSQSGVIECNPVCDHCGDTYDADNGYSVLVSRNDYETWCDHCHDNGTFYCNVIDETVSDYCGQEYEDESGDTVTCASWAIDRTDATECSDGVYRVNASHCHSCASTLPDEDMASDTDDGGDAICQSCHDEAVACDAIDSPELPLEAIAA